MTPESDPRVFFAAERTLLAWIRTGLAVVGLGFIVARFGLFLRMMRTGSEAAPQTSSTVIGVALVLLGSLAMAVAAWQHVQFCRRLPPESAPRPNSVRWPVWFAGMIAGVGVALAAYLVIRTGG
jgi:putative membrane protein